MGLDFLTLRIPCYCDFDKGFPRGPFLRPGGTCFKRDTAFSIAEGPQLVASILTGIHSGVTKDLLNSKALFPKELIISSISNLPRKLPLPVRSYEIAKKGEIPEVLSATLYRTLKSCWICDDEQLMKWEVRLPYDQEYACPPVWQDEWRITGRDRGPLIANGLMLETQLAEAREQQAAFDAFVAKRTQEILDERAATRRQAEEEQIEYLAYERWRSERISLTHMMDAESKAKLVFKLSKWGC